MLMLFFLSSLSNDLQKWKRLFHAPFVLQAFAAHLSAIEGSVNVPDLHDKPSPATIGALGLAAASVSMLNTCVLLVF